jgi:hypothetical protein
MTPIGVFLCGESNARILDARKCFLDSGSMYRSENQNLTYKGTFPVDGATFKKNVHILVEHPWFGFIFCGIS